MLGTRINLELAELGASERALRQHAADCTFDGTLRMLCEHLHVGRLFDATRETGVVINLLLFALRAGQGNLVGVDNDDEVTGVNVRREYWLVLAPQQGGGV